MNSLSRGLKHFSPPSIPALPRAFVRQSVLSALGLILLLGLCPTRADENLFGYTYTTDVLPKGKWEVEQWVTGRTGKESGSYLGMDFRTEIETGLTDRLQGSLYLNYNYHRLKNAQGSEEMFDDRNRFGISGTSMEFKYQVLSPYKDRFGLALYLEPGYGTIHKTGGERFDEFELEFKLILEKHWREDRLVGTFNYTVEPEWEKASGESGYETNLQMEWSTGLSYRIASHWNVGLETRVHTEFADADLNQSSFVSAFVGPNIHYGRGHWWATLAVLPQVFGWPDARGKGGLHFDEHERVEVRLKVGFNF